MTEDRIELSVEIRQATDLAFLVFDGDKEVWVPKSLIEEPDDLKISDKCQEISVPVWFAEREGLI